MWALYSLPAQHSFNKVFTQVGAERMKRARDWLSQWSRDWGLDLPATNHYQRPRTVFVSVVITLGAHSGGVWALKTLFGTTQVRYMGSKSRSSDWPPRKPSEEFLRTPKPYFVCRKPPKITIDLIVQRHSDDPITEFFCSNNWWWDLILWCKYSLICSILTILFGKNQTPVLSTL